MGLEFLLLGNCRLLQIHFLSDAYDLFTTHIDGLDTHHFVTHEPHEIDILRRLTINPLFVVGLAILFADLLRWPALGVDHHLPVHSNQDAVTLDRIFDLGRNCLQIGLCCRFRIKVENRAEEIFKLLRIQIRDVVIED